MSAPTIEAIAQTVEEVGKEHASSTGQGPKTDHNAQAAIGTWRHLRETMRSVF
jgi:poly(hydroxyalkanoate) depolymerase family esterase